MKYRTLPQSKRFIWEPEEQKIGAIDIISQLPKKLKPLPESLISSTKREYKEWKEHREIIELQQEICRFEGREYTGPELTPIKDEAKIKSIIKDEKYTKFPTHKVEDYDYTAKLKHSRPFRGTCPNNGVIPEYGKSARIHASFKEEDRTLELLRFQQMEDLQKKARTQKLAKLAYIQRQKRFSSLAFKTPYPIPHSANIITPIIPNSKKKAQTSLATFQQNEKEEIKSEMDAVSAVDKFDEKEDKYKKARKLMEKQEKERLAKGNADDFSSVGMFSLSTLPFRR